MFPKRTGVRREDKGKFVLVYVMQAITRLQVLASNILNRGHRFREFSTSYFCPFKRVKLLLVRLKYTVVWTSDQICTHEDQTNFLSLRGNRITIPQFSSTTVLHTYPILNGGVYVVSSQTPSSVCGRIISVPGYTL